MHANAVHRMQVATAAFKTLMALFSDTSQWEALTGCRTRLPTGGVSAINCFAYRSPQTPPESLNSFTCLRIEA